MIVRELIALLGIDLQDQDVRKVDTAVSRFEDRMRKVGQFIGGSIFLAGFARATHATIKFASDARETLNLVRESFGDNAADVEAWSVEVSKRIGRSEFLMREMAGTLGALLNPLLDRNTEAAARMSTALSELAVDLASFFNITEDEALVALRAGLSGETEPLKRLGVILTEVGLQEQARREGLTKSIKTMTVAEKTALRFRTIMHQTAAAQGDAARTSEEYANASRAAADAIRDLATRIGDRLLPFARRFLTWARDATRQLIDVTRQSNIVEGALLALGAAAIVAAGLLLASFFPTILLIAKVALAIGAAAIAADELITFFRGGKTVIGEFIDELLGIGAAQKLIDDLNAGWQQMAEWFETLIKTYADLQRALGIGPQTPRAARRGTDAPLAEGSPTFEEFEDDARRRRVDRDFARAVRRGSTSPVVGSRRGSTGRERRLQRARQLEAISRERRLTAREQREFVAITDTPHTLLPETHNERRRREIAERRAREATAEQRRRATNRAELRRAIELQRQSREAATTVTLPVAPPARRQGGSVQQNNTFHIDGCKDPEVVGREIRRQLARELEDAGAALGEGVGLPGATIVP